jgi:hypothetical protein
MRTNQEKITTSSGLSRMDLTLKLENKANFSYLLNINNSLFIFILIKVILSHISLGLLAPCLLYKNNNNRKKDDKKVSYWTKYKDFMRSPQILFSYESVVTLLNE